MIRNGSGYVTGDCDDREQDMKLRHIPNTSPERTPNQCREAPFERKYKADG